jgi:flagellar biosynthesis/type III secretory pathway chaperone
VDPQQCAGLLARLIEEESKTLAELAVLLEHEHDLLARSGSVEALEDACEARQICMGTLLRIQDERRGLLRLLGLPDAPASFDALLAGCDADGTLRRRWTATLDQARLCRELNDRNGALVSAKMRRVQGLLHVLTGQPAAPSLYEAQGRVARNRIEPTLSTRA